MPPKGLLRRCRSVWVGGDGWGLSSVPVESMAETVAAMRSLEIWQPAQMGGALEGSRLLETRMAAALSMVKVQSDMVEVDGQRLYCIAAKARESRAARHSRMPLTLRTPHQVALTVVFPDRGEVETEFMNWGL